MVISRIYETDYYRDLSEVFEEYKKKEATVSNEQYSTDYVTDYIKGRFGDQKTAVEKTVNDLAKRTGLMEYIKKVNAALEASPDSLLDIPEIKEAIDSVLITEKDRSYIDICNKLQKLVDVDDRIPEGLKSVFNDKKLIEYVQQRADSKKDKNNEIDYLSGIRTKEQDNPAADQRGQNYFHFTPDEHENK
jgi:hypothetical protein